MYQPDLFTFDASLAYDAGLFDGEGSVFLNQNRKRRDGSYSYVTRCTMTLTDLRSIERMRDRWGGSLIGPQVRGTLSKRPLWQWSVTGRNAQRFLRCVLPHLQIKAREAEAVLCWNGVDGAALQEHVREMRKEQRHV